MNPIKELLYRLRGEYTTERLISMGMQVGEHFNRLHGVILDPSHCWLIQIGDNVTMAPRVHILCHDASSKLFLGYTKIGRVTIGSNVFIGAESVVLPGVTIGDNVIIGANSTVTRDIPSGSVAAGSPARILCTLDEHLRKMPPPSWTPAGLRPGVHAERKHHPGAAAEAEGGAGRWAHRVYCLRYARHRILWNESAHRRYTYDS